MSHSNRVFFSCAGALALSWAELVAAQVAPANPGVPEQSSTNATSAAIVDEAGIGDIIVTAEKRESTVQRTAIAMSVFNSEALKRNGVGALTDLAGLAPSVNIAQNSVNTIVTIRGVSSRDTTEIGDPAVSISVDGFYYQRPFGLNDAVYDLDRIEVLRGPQGTLYGRNATGGAINFIMAKPGKDFASSATVGYGNYKQLTAEGFVNVPISEIIQTRASFSVRRHDGYRTNNYQGNDGDDADAVSVRLSVQAEPTDRLTMLLTGQYTHLGGVGPTFFGVPIVGAANYSVQPKFNRKGSVLGSPKQNLDGNNKSVQWNIGYDLDFATFTYLGGFRNQKYTQIRDLDGLFKSDAYFLPSEDARDWQHELRLTSSGDGPFQWQIGGFYFKEKNTLSTFFSTYQSPLSPGQPLARFAFVYPSVTSESKAVFGQASYEIIDGLKAEAGIRYSKDDKARRGYANTTNTAYTGIGNVPTDVSAGSDKVTYHFALNWQATPHNLFYVKRDTGYKAGGFSDVQNVGSVPYGPENITSYEIGAKNQLLDNKLQLNLSAFRYNYKDQQISQFSNGFTAIFNAGKSRIWGLEAEFVAKPTTHDQLDGYVGYLHARFLDFLVGTVQYAGNTPPQSPSWQVNGGYQHVFDVGRGTVTPRIQTHFETHSFLAFNNRPLERQDSYTRSDAMLTYTAPDDKWSVQGYVRNIENKTILTAATASGLFGAYTFQFEAPRTYGVRATVNF